MTQNVLDRLQKSLEQFASLGIVKGWMRLGYAAKGVIYLTVGLFALGEALGFSFPLLGTEGVLLAITQQRLGVFLLFLLAVGIAGYAFWRFVQALADPEHSDSLSPLRIVQRLGYAVSGLSYTSVVYASVELLTDLKSEQDDTIEDIAAQLVETGWGVALLVLVGLTIVGIGLTYIYGGLSEAYISQFKASCHRHLSTAATRLGQVGYTARGVSFTVIGVGILQAAFLAQSDPAGGLKDALEKLEAQPYGRLSLGLIAVGFIAYAVYAFLVALYRRFKLR
ncbi:MAG: DUF1206 domain-containing protein [Cyanobacteria bacterium P01_A01_bin.114]